MVKAKIPRLKTSKNASIVIISSETGAKSKSVTRSHLARPMPFKEQLPIRKSHGETTF